MNTSKYIIGNWKLNKISSDINTFFSQLNEFLKNNSTSLQSNNIIHAIAPSSPYLQLTSKLKTNSTNIIAQDVSTETSGNYTSQISCLQLLDLNVRYAIVGHSETRKYLNVNDQIVNKKVLTCLSNKISPIICIGESLDEYKNKLTKLVLTKQLKTIFENVNINNAENCIIAYEPLWAIGSGITPTLTEISTLSLLIRKTMENIFNYDISNEIAILYGGSVNDKNASDIIKQNNVNGLLIGGASLDANKFIRIIDNINKWIEKK